LGATGCLGFDDGGQLGHGTSLSRVERRSSAEFVDHTLERLNLCRELAGGLAIIPVFDLECSVRRQKLVPLDAGTPSSTETNEQRQPENRQGRHRGGAQTNRQAANNAAGTIGNQYRVTTSHVVVMRNADVPDGAGLSIRRN